MTKINLYCVGKPQPLPITTDFDDLTSLASFLFRNKYFIGEIDSEEGGLALQRVLVPLFRCDLIFEE